MEKYDYRRAITDDIKDWIMTEDLRTNVTVIAGATILELGKSTTVTLPLL